MIEETKKKIHKFYIYFLFILGFGLILLAVYLNILSYHNIDLSYNMCRIASFYDEDYSKWEDIYDSDGKSMTYTKLYIISWDYNLFAFFMALIGGICVGYSINEFEVRKSEKNN